jgi:hypothetical protein
LQRWNLEFEISRCVIYAGSGNPRMARTRKSTPRFFKDTSKKYIVTMVGRLGGRRYNRFSLQVESEYSDYLRVVILGNDRTTNRRSSYEQRVRKSTGVVLLSLW